MNRFIQTKDDFDPSNTCGLCGAPLNDDLEYAADAAAPDLLEAMTRLLEVCRYHEEPFDSEEADAARAAIAKATGESNG